VETYTGRSWVVASLFTLAGKRVRESADTPLKTIAREAEQDRRRELEKTLHGMPIEKRENRINSVSDLVKTYLERYELDHRGRPNSIIFAKGRLAHVVRLLGNSRLPDLTDDSTAIHQGATVRRGKRSNDQHGARRTLASHR